MAFRDSDPSGEMQAHEMAMRLDQVVLDSRDVQGLEKALRYMSVNHRQTLKRALEIAERSK